MIDLFLKMPIWVQVFCVMCMAVGFRVIYRFRKISMIIAIGAIIMWLSITYGG